VLSIYGSIIAILILMPFYLTYLAPTLYAKEPISYTATCFAQSNSLYLAIGAENRSQETRFVESFYVYAIRAGSWHRVPEKRYVFQIKSPRLFDGLKEEVVVGSQETRRFRLKVTPKDPSDPKVPKVQIGAGSWRCSIWTDRPARSDEVYLEDASADVEVLR
jgi:hypothetical protein